MPNWRKPLLLFLLKVSGQKSYGYFKEIKKAGLSSLDEKQSIINQKLENILLHAYESTSYYRRVLKEYSVVSSDEKTILLENFTKLPILNKEILRKEFINLQDTSKNSRKTFQNTSGGSTGEPVSFVQDNVFQDWVVATKFYFMSFLSKDIGERELRLWGSERDLLIGKDTFTKRLKDWLYNRVECNSFKMTEENMEKYVRSINSFKPKVIEAYVQSIYELAKFIEDKKLTVFSPKGGIITSAGTLYPDMELLIRDVFKCKVINRYGTREVGDVACSQDGSENLTINFLQNYVEILDSKYQPVKQGETGKIYITTLNNLSMPLIRYEIGDIGVQSDRIDEIKKIEGREMSVFKTKDGKVIPGEFFIHFIGVVYNNGGISKIQVIQEDYEKIIIKTIVRDKKIFEDDKSQIEASIKEVMGSPCEIIFDFVDDIPPLPSGKFLYTISKVV